MQLNSKFYREIGSIISVSPAAHDEYCHEVVFMYRTVSARLTTVSVL